MHGMQDDLVKMLADAIKEEGTTTDTGTLNLAMAWDTQMFALKDGLLENGIACGVFATCSLLACWNNASHRANALKLRAPPSR